MKGFFESYANENVLALGAHPDDVEIGAGGTIARLAEAGARVTIVSVCVPDKLEQRVEEARAAADILGAKAVVLNTGRTCRVEDLKMYEIVAALDNVVRELRPAALLTHSVEETHYDHVLVSNAVMSTLRLHPMDVFFYAPTTCRNVVRNWQASLYLDISPVIERKISSIAAHSSQFGARGLCVETFREHARTLGSPLGMEYAEGFKILRMAAV